MCFSSPKPPPPVQQQVAPTPQAPPTPPPTAPVLPSTDSTNPRQMASARKRLRIDLAPRAGTGLAIPQ
jgi:hypothetical protein